MSSANEKKPLEENRRILVVEDEKEIANAYVDILSASNGKKESSRRSSRSKKQSVEDSEGQQGFELMVAYNAGEALRYVEESIKIGKPFAMGFFDVLLGEGLDGIELVKRIYAIDPEIFAVFVTAYHDRSVDSINELLGIENSTRWDYLNKPFSEGEILQKARNAVALWNVTKERDEFDKRLAEASKKLMSNERMASVAAVARGVGHEFGNILVQIIGTAELKRDGSKEEMEKGFDTILKAADTASHILERFKGLAKPVEPSEEFRDENVVAILDEAVELLEHMFKTSNIRIGYIKKVDAKIQCSKNSLVQVFVNLLINSIHAMESGGQIDLSVSSVENEVEVKIRDYGPGISEEYVEKITEAFFTTKDTGTGLGLSICKEIVEIEHRGYFLIHNQGMKGAEVIMRFPKEIEIQIEEDGDVKVPA